MIHKWILGLLVVALGMIGYALWRQERSGAPTLQEITGALSTDRVNLSIQNTVGVEMTTITTKWTSSQGEHSVTTTRQDGESEQDWISRHAHEVQTAQQQFPPI